MKYSELLSLLSEYAEEDFASFQKKLIPTKQQILGVRTPILRKIAQKLNEQKEDIFAYPDEIYEVTFIKLAIISRLSYEKFILYVKDCVEKIDNWATCDTFKAKCIDKHKQEFLPILEEIFSHGGEFYERYVLVTLLSFYIEEPFLSRVKEYIKRADTEKYYIHMAVAWLVAELLINQYDFGVSLLKEGLLPQKTHNKAIQKARESYRLSTEQKDFLKSLKK